MARETIKCPHCECKVLMSEVEKDDGLCPECGQLVLASSLFDDFDDDDDLELDEYIDFDEDETVADDDDDDEEDDFLGDDDDEDDEDFDDEPPSKQKGFRRRRKGFD